MKKCYKTPVAKMIVYEYDTQVKAQSFSCSGVIYTAKNGEKFTMDCNEWRHSVNPNLRSSDPCIFETPIMQ